MAYREQLSLTSRGKGRKGRSHVAPRRAMFEDGVKNDEKFAHTSDQGHLFRFTGRQQLLVEVADDRVVTAAHQRCHIERARTRERPPQTVRWPLRVPLSRLKGATPTRAAICRRSSVPNSGR